MNKLLANFFIAQLCIIILGCKNAYDIDMVYISGGSYLMGSEEINADSDERPIHAVNVNDFYIGRYEVTQKQWKAVMGHDPSHHRGLDYPVENVSWDDCQKYIEKLNKITGKNYRLPTEEEWEYVASQSYKKIAKEAISSYVWWRGSFKVQTPYKMTSQKVGSLKSDDYGLYDIIGNVNEWCYDSYDSLSYLNGFPCETDEKVFRGGCFANDENYLSPTNRNHINRYTRHYTLGLRLAMDAIP